MSWFWLRLPMFPGSGYLFPFQVGEVFSSYVFRYVLWPLLSLSSPSAAAAKSLPSCPTLCDSIDGSPAGFPTLGFSRQEHWSGLPSPSPMHESEKWKWKVEVKSLSHVQLLATSWTAAHQAPLPMGFSRQEYWSGCHCLLFSFWDSSNVNVNILDIVTEAS